MTPSPDLITNREKHRYEFHIEDQTPHIEYLRAKDKIYLTHTEVPTSLEGKGIGSQLVVQVLRDIEEKNLTLIPLCPFVAMYIKNNPEWKKLVLKGVNFS